MDFGKKRQLEDSLEPLSKKQKNETDINEIKIKTLEEIRAERAKKAQNLADSSANDICDSCVSSSTEEVKKTKIKLQRKPVYIEEKNEENDGKEEIKVVYKPSDSSDVDINQSSNDASNKTVDEILLLQDDDDNDNVSLKEEEALLNDLDEFMED